MKKYFFLILLISSFGAFAEVLTLKISETKNKAGNLLIAVYSDPEGFPDQRPQVTKIIPTSKERTTYSAQLNLPEGSYAISVFLDENANNILDKNLLGIPKERFGFSNNPSITTRAPEFEECKIEVHENTGPVEIELMKLI